MKSSSSDRIILISDYGRSGQGWLSYMLCYILNARYIEPYSLIRGKDCSFSEYIIENTNGNIPGRKKTRYDLVVKTHNLPIREANFSGKVIFLTRDPRDVAVSALWWHKNGAKSAKWKNIKGKIFWTIATKIRIIDYVLTAKGWTSYYSSQGKNLPFHVKYEDLSAETKKTLLKILDYINVSAEYNIIDEAIEKFSFEKITGRKKGQEDKKNSEFRKGIVGDYKNYFSTLELKIFGLICGKTARKAGYKL
ncbi:MAG: sulfotransferase domain-containing protein [Candidatus Staskawiczbacteria bacterium]|nr:sulfotransferase domain-containing protein [Candidatus Staskawiczbacteria bacterium]